MKTYLLAALAVLGAAAHAQTVTGTLPDYASGRFAIQSPQIASSIVGSFSASGVMSATVPVAGQYILTVTSNANAVHPGFAIYFYAPGTGTTDISSQLASAEPAAQTPANGGISGTCAGDLTGIYPNCTVAKIGGQALSAAAVGAAPSTYTQGSPGSVPITQSVKNAETLNAVEFGLVGDGVTDNTTSLQAAINAASALGQGTYTGQIIHLNPGIYAHSGTITLPRNVVLEGSGKLSTILMYTGTGVAWVLGDTSLTAGEALTQSWGMCDLMMMGPGAGTSTIGLFIGADPAGKLAPTNLIGNGAHFENWAITGFGVAGNPGSNAYLLSFLNFTFVDNGQQWVDAIGTNAGERNSWIGGIFYQAQSTTSYAIVLNNNLADNFYQHDSFDYDPAAQPTFGCTGGQFRGTFSQDHFERAHGVYFQIDTTKCGGSILIDQSTMSTTNNAVVGGTAQTVPDAAFISILPGFSEAVWVSVQHTQINSNEPVSYIVDAGNSNRQIELSSNLIENYNGNLLGCVNTHGSAAGIFTGRQTATAGTAVCTAQEGESKTINGTETATGGFFGNLTGNVTGNVAGNVTGSLTGNATTATSATTAATATAVPLSGITAPTANLSVNTNSYAISFNGGAATSTTNLFSWMDSANNTGTGFVATVGSSTGSTAMPFRVMCAGVGCFFAYPAGNIGINTLNQYGYPFEVHTPGDNADATSAVISTAHGAYNLMQSALGYASSEYKYGSTADWKAGLFGNSNFVILKNGTTNALSINYTTLAASFFSTVQATSFASSISRKTANYTATANDSTILVDCTSGPVTITLPPIVAGAYQVVTVKKVDSTANAVTVTAGGTIKIDGGTTLSISTQYSAYQEQTDGTQWWIL